jgi:predicted transcriptional regulator
MEKKYMSKKQTFINEVLALTGDNPEAVFSSDALDYWNGLNISGDGKKKTELTEKGKLILDFMRKNKDQYNNLFKAKDIGDGMLISSRTVAGSMRKLVTDGYIEKIGSEPSVYAVTNKGLEVNFGEKTN